MINLYQLSESEFPQLAESSERLYAESLVKSGRFGAEDAAAIATRTRESFIGEGLATQNCHFFAIRENADGAAIGHIILWVQRHGLLTLGHIWYIAVSEQNRRRGIGTEALRLLEAKAREVGVDQLELAVFAYNDAAIGLYNKVGYRASSFTMSKDVGDI